MVARSLPLSTKAVVALNLVFFGLLVGVPLSSVLFYGVVSGSQQGTLVLMVDPEIIAIVRVTVLQAFFSVLFSGLIGFFVGLALGSLPQSGALARGARLLLLWPFGVPTVVAGTAWVVCLSRNGVLNQFGLDWAYSLRAVILAHVFFNAPWVAFVVAQARSRIPISQVEAASTLGARPFQVFCRVIWPSVRWSGCSALAQVASLCIASFALVLILGGGPPVQTIETAIYARIRFGTLDWSGALALSLWQVLLSMVPWAVLLWSETRRKNFDFDGSGIHGKTLGWQRMKAVICLGAAVVFVLPYAGVFAGGKSALAPELVTALMLSLRIALSVALGSVILALLQSWSMEILSLRPRLQAILGVFYGVPSAVSVLVLGFGFLLAYGRWIDPFEGSLSVIVALQVALFSPLAFRILWPVLRQRPISQGEAASTLGAGWFEKWRTVEWPRWKRPLAASVGLVGGAALGEVAAVSLFYSERLVPLPLLISRWMAQYRFEEASLASAVLLVAALLLTTFAWLGGEVLERVGVR